MGTPILEGGEMVLDGRGLRPLGGEITPGRFPVGGEITLGLLE